MRFLFFLLLLFSAILSQNFIGYGQSWREMTDSSNVFKEKQDYETALKWSKLALSAAEKEYGRNDTNYTSCLGSIVELYYLTGHLDSALNLQDNHLRICRALFLSDHPDLAQSISNMALFNNANGRYAEAEPLYKEALEMRRRLFKGDHPDLAQSISNLAYFYDGRGRYTEAEPLYKEALEMRRRLFEGDQPNLAQSINNMAYFYAGRGRYAEAEPLYREALEMRRRLFPGGHPDLANSINNMAYFYAGRGRYAEAEPLYKEALEMRRRLFPGGHPDLANSINNMAFFYNNMGRYAEAEPLYKEALEMRRRLFTDDHPDLANSINNMAFFYNARGRYAGAEPLYKEALDMYRRLFPGDHPDLAASINNLAAFYNGRGRYVEAEPLLIEALNMQRRLFKGDHPNLANSINNLAAFYDGRGSFAEAEPLYKEALDMRRRLFTGDHPDLATSINNIASFYEGRGRIAEAELLLNEALNMQRRLFKGDHPDLALGINNMAAYYNSQGRFAEAEPLYKEALDMRRRLFTDDHPDLANSINNLAYFYVGRGRFAEAEPLYKEALDMRRRLYPGGHPNLALSLNNMATLYELTVRFAEAEPLFKEALDLYRGIYKNGHPNLTTSINNLAAFYNRMEKFPEAEALYVECLNIIINMVNNYFPSLSEKEKIQFWNTVSKDFESFYSFSTKRAEANPSIICNMYDLQLYSKALLFNSFNRIKSRITSSRDSVLTSMYRRWTDMREYLIKLYKMTDTQLKARGISLDSIENVANDLEKNISLKSEDFKQSYERKKVNWKTIQAILKPDEAVVEVVRFRKYKDRHFSDTINYAFLIVSDATEDNPDIVLLENGNILESEFYAEYRHLVGIKAKDTLSYGRFWGKLGEKLKGYKKIYLSPDGIYNKLNPSTLLMPGGKYILDNLDIQIVNSSKDLLFGYFMRQDKESIYNSALLVGNPNFALSEQEMIDASTRMRSESQVDEFYENPANSRGIQLTRLPGTEKEIKDIEKLLRNKKWEVKCYLGDNAIKEALKKSSSPRILHIATHGLFLEDVKRGGQELFGFGVQKMIDNPLLRSGLFFSGAENYLKGDKKATTGNENGILTAYEAMNLDLDKSELLVLSACETGLGEIQNGEGVFGLRRSFQQAGVKTIIMSLWKVDDDATQKLMSSFYNNWIGKGMTKRAAFSKAQQDIRLKYKAPYYWGAFVMVGE